MPEISDQNIMDQLPKPPAGEAFDLVEMDRLFYPHPYCITPLHVKITSDHHRGLLDENAIVGAERRGAHCGVSRCQLKYKEHRSERVLKIAVPKDTEHLNQVPGLHQYLLSIKEQVEQLGIAGFVFLKGSTADLAKAA